jgi:ketosteroid isomerase-like protein
MASTQSEVKALFDGYHGPINLEVRDLKILESRDLAVAHWLSRARGTLTNGREVGSWVRASSCCRWSDGQWLVTHEHISLPVDVTTGSAVTDLVP